MSTLKNFKPLGQFDPAPALRELAGAGLWDVITLRQDIKDGPHKDTKCIILRGPDLTLPDAFDSPHCVDYPYAVLPACHELVTNITYPLPIKAVGRIFVVSLRAGGHIHRHTDYGRYADAYQRLHISLQSGEGNIFHCGDEAIHMAPGTAWAFNHKADHEVFNRSDHDRIHIIVDVIKDQPWEFQQQ